MTSKTLDGADDVKMEGRLYENIYDLLNYILTIRLPSDDMDDS